LLPAIDFTALHHVAWFGPVAVALVVKRVIDRRFQMQASPIALAP